MLETRSLSRGGWMNYRRLFVRFEGCRTTPSPWLMSRFPARAVTPWISKRSVFRWRLCAFGLLNGALERLPGDEQQLGSHPGVEQLRNRTFPNQTSSPITARFTRLVLYVESQHELTRPARVPNGSPDSRKHAAFLRADDEPRSSIRAL